MLSAVFVLCVAVFPGERLDYDVRYGPVALGRLTLETLEPETVSGTECYHFGAELELTRSISWLFWAEYRLESWCRTRDMVTLRSYKRTREPNYRAEWTADYDPERSLARYSDGESLATGETARDLLTTWYYLRAIPLKPGDAVKLAIHVDRRNYQLSAVVGQSKLVTTAAGRFDCLAVTPRTSGPVGTVYLSDDSERLPVLIRTRVGGLVVTARLRHVSHEEER